MGRRSRPGGGQLSLAGQAFRVCRLFWVVAVVVGVGWGGVFARHARACVCGKRGGGEGAHPGSRPPRPRGIAPGTAPAGHDRGSTGGWGRGARAGGAGSPPGRWSAPPGRGGCLGGGGQACRSRGGAGRLVMLGGWVGGGGAERLVRPPPPPHTQKHMHTPRTQADPPPPPLPHPASPGSAAPLAAAYGRCPACRRPPPPACRCCHYSHYSYCLLFLGDGSKVK